MEYTANGKILLLGGYTVLVKPNLSLVLGVNAYVRVEIIELKDKKVKIFIPQFKIKKDFSIQELSNLKIEGKDKFVLNAIKACFEYLKFKKLLIKGFKITTKSDSAFSVNNGKSGLGSSAAVTVATVKAILGLHGCTDENEIHKISQYSHSISQGKVGSGFDIASALYGTIIYSRYSPDLIDLNNPSKLFKTNLDCKIKKVNLSDFNLVFANIPNSSMDTTSSVLKFFKFIKSNPSNQIINEINSANSNAIEALQSEDLNAFKNYFEQARKLTKELGKVAGIEIEPDELSNMIGESYDYGAFVCKLPGAGGMDSIVALCTTNGAALRLKTFWKQRGLAVINLNLYEASK